MTKPDDGDPFERELISLLPRVRRFALTLTRSREEGDDLVQGALEKALTHSGQWQRGTRLDSWLYRIVQNHWIDTLRARRARGTAVPLDEVPGLDAGGAGDPENRLMLQRTREAMAALPEEQRVVLSLVAVEGRTYAETAEILGIPIGTVMSRLSRARAGLAVLLGDRKGTRP